MSAARVIPIVAAMIRDDARRVLLVRKRGTTAFMQPGGKPGAGESELAALGRELREELGCSVVEGTQRSLGRFSALAANEPGYIVDAAVYVVSVEGAIAPQAEIAEAVWVDPGRPGALELAPLTRDHLLPLAASEENDA